MYQNSSKRSITIEADQGEDRLIDNFFNEISVNLITQQWHPNNKQNKNVNAYVRIKIVYNPVKNKTDAKYHDDMDVKPFIIRNVDVNKSTAHKNVNYEDDLIIKKYMVKQRKLTKDNKNFKRISLKAEIIFKIEQLNFS